MNPLDVLRRARDLFARAWPLWSVRVAAIGALLTTIAAATPDTLLQIWNMLPPEILALVPPAIGRVVPTLLFVLTIVVRMIPQTPASERQSLWKSVSGRVAPRKAGGIAAAALAMIAATMVFEGGYVNHPADPGGETNMGITKRVALASGYTGPMRTLPADVAQSIYYDQYLVQPGYAPLIAIDAAVTEELFDTTVNMGAARPGRWFQQGINQLCGSELLVDGRVGAGTIGAYKACQTGLGATKLCVAMLDILDAKQRDEYGRLVRVRPSLKVFYRGWVAQRIGNVDRARCRTPGA